MNILKNLLQTKNFKLCIAIVTAQQILVATGTYLMGDLAATVLVQGLSIPRVVILVLCLILSGSLFHFLMKHFMVLAQRDVLKAYFDKYAEANFSRPDIWRSKEIKETKHDIMVREGQDTITQSVQFAADTVATGLNVILNTVSVILVTSPAMGLSILVAGLLGLLVIHCADKMISQAAEKEMLAQNEVNNSLARSWDNIVLGNKTSYHRWMDGFSDLFAKAKQASLYNVKINDGATSIASFITSSVVMVSVCALLYFSKNDLSKVIALLIMLPRSMQIVFHIQIIQSYWAHWKYLLQRLKMTEATYSSVDAEDLDKYINKAKIQIVSNVSTVSTTEDILLHSTGRFTVTGENGAGKSTLLLKLKDKIGTKGFYIPSHHHLELSDSSFSKSSGEVAMMALKDALADSASTVLLDEWDANLSKDNQAKLNDLINEISKTKLVIEVRHHHVTA
ncbi:hypothetical protein ACES2L_12265 [Bdellovibrio bacteriovorus]